MILRLVLFASLAFGLLGLSGVPIASKAGSGIDPLGGGSGHASSNGSGDTVDGGGFIDPNG